MIKEFFRSMWVTVLDTVLDLARQWEATVLLLLAAIGLSSALHEAPFIVAMPVAIESLLVAPMVVPAVSVVVITTLVYLMMRKEGNEN